MSIEIGTFILMILSTMIYVDLEVICYMILSKQHLT